MKNDKYILYFFIFLLIIFRNNLVNVINNIGKIIINYDDNLEISYLNNQYQELKKEYNNLIDFKNNIDIKDNYIITNVYKNNYGFNKLIINGNNYNLNSEVLNEEGLIGTITKINNKYSEITYIYDLNIPVIINDKIGKIVDKDDNNNLIIKEINNVNLNDKVYSINNSYIGKVINIIKEELDYKIIVQPINLQNINYVIVKEL